MDTPFFVFDNLVNVAHKGFINESTFIRVAFFEASSVFLPFILYPSANNGLGLISTKSDIFYPWKKIDVEDSFSVEKPVKCESDSRTEVSEREQRGVSKLKLLKIFLI